MDTLTGPPQGGRAGPAGPAAALAAEQDRILACVHCGFCLDACPTYTRLGLESDSPRGRIYLMRAVAEGRIDPAADAFQLHIDRCLGCRACEPVCPSGVEYGHLLERAREVIGAVHGTDRLTRMLLAAVARPALGALVWAGGRLLRATDLAGWLARRLPDRFARARFAMAMLDATRPQPVQKPRPGQGTPAGASAAPAAGRTEPGPGSVALLEGCVQKGLFGRVNRATARVLGRSGFRVTHAPGQGCCGALHAHAGRLEDARRLALRTMDAFERAGAERILVNAAGCGAMMKDYGGLFENTPVHDRAQAFAARVVDWSELLVEGAPPSGPPLALRAAWDSPCHLLHAQRIGSQPVDVLRAALPGLDVTPVARHDECCGGAGVYGLTHPELGGRILADKVAAVRAANADVVLTPNPGCLMQIGAGLRLAGDVTPVLHPVELIDFGQSRVPAAEHG